MKENRAIVSHVIAQMKESGYDVKDMDVYDMIQHAVGFTIQQLEFKAQDEGGDLVHNI